MTTRLGVPAALLVCALACDRSGDMPGPQGDGTRTDPLPPARTAEEVRASCAVYDQTGSVSEYCAYRLVSSVESVADVLSLCGEGGMWSGACRTAWVEPRLHPDSGVDRAVLMQACGTDADCTLDVLDHRPLPLRDQLEACATAAGANLRHCVSHAVSRWREGGGQEPTLEALLADPGPAPALLGEYLAEAVVCDGRGRCGGAPAVAEACTARAEVLRRDRGQCRRALAPGARPQRRGSRGNGRGRPSPPLSRP